MLSKRMEVTVCILSSVVAIAALLLPIVESKPDEAVQAFSTVYTAPVVIIDAGHGGEDGGAVSLNGIYESEINLSISLKLEQVFAFLGLKTLMTRNTNDIDYPPDAETVRAKKIYDQKSRVELINSTPDCILISIHQNKYTDTLPSGAQVLYASNTGSSILGEAIQTSLIAAVGEENVRPMTPVSPDIYLMKQVSCPAVLIECGFLSNWNDEALLITNEYQMKLVCGIASGYIGATENLIYNYGGINEG